jgi:hypothetical protein
MHSRVRGVGDVLKAFGSMGLRHYDGSPRASDLSRWTAAR